MSVLQVNNLTKEFTSGLWPFKTPKTYAAVNNISFEVGKGEILGFLGPNGAGKTTTIQMLLGCLLPTTGSINYFGLDFDQERIAILKKIGYASGYDKLPARLTVIENLEVVGRIYGMPKLVRTQQIERLLKTFNIWELRNRPTGSLSAGQATRVMLTKAFINNPQIVLLDEPTASLDPDVAQDVRNFIIKQRQEHQISILITSHNMSEVTELCDRVIILQNGQIIANDTPEMLAKTGASHVQVNLNITSDFNKLITYLKISKIDCTTKPHNLLVVNIDEHLIANLLTDLAKQEITYSQISIAKPTLEDYFLSIAKQKTGDPR